MHTIRRILVANRGEITRRVFRTCRALGIDTVAVFSDADAAMPFVREADIAVRLGPAPSSASYLCGDRILEIAREVGADAVHPGYGFLSENGDFAQACADAGLVFIGPSPAAIRAMGLKRESKETVAAAGVPVVPGAGGATQQVADLVAAAATVGFPLLVKASAGGGGKGMRIVHREGELVAAIEGAKREAAASFGDDTVILERYVTAPRHVEIQVLGDQHGHIVHLFERECSIQRRHQKVIEEAPSPALTPALRAAMGQAAVTAARTIGYHNAGTVEFILDSEGAFYFLEMNTRLQVEHPVTEAVTGVDLVAAQIRVAEGYPLPFAQDDLRLDGAAIEARLYAEDAGSGFLPATGTISAWTRPVEPWLRIDSGVEVGDEVSIHYDPMIAKVIAQGPTREEARRRLSRALREMGIAGLTTNRAFLVRVLEHPEFIAGELDTHFIERWGAALVPQPTASETARSAIAATLHAHGLRRADRALLPALRSGYRNVRTQAQRVVYDAGGETWTVGTVQRADGSFDVSCEGGDLHLQERWAVVDWTPVRVRMRRHDDHGADRIDALDVLRSGSTALVRWLDAEVVLVERPRFAEPNVDAVAGGCRAPMPGKIVRVEVEAGAIVVAGQALVVMEAMKMEHTIRAAAGGRVADLRVEVGDQVEADAVLAVVEAGSL